MAISVFANPGQNILIPKPGFAIYRCLAGAKSVESRFYNLLVRLQHVFLVLAFLLSFPTYITVLPLNFFVSLKSVGKLILGTWSGWLMTKRQQLWSTIPAILAGLSFLKSIYRKLLAVSDQNISFFPLVHRPSVTISFSISCQEAPCSGHLGWDLCWNGL